METKVDEEIHAWLQDLPNVRPDGEAKSDQFRERGNEIFKSKQDDHLALEAYSKAIFAAPAGSNALALGHANRAVILIRFHRYREALDDCQLALDGNYPETANKLKIFFRQAECAEKLNDAHTISSIVEGISAIAVNRELTKLEREKLQELQKLAEPKASNVSDQHATPVGDNLSLPLLKEKRNTSQGRYVVTMDPIEENSIITRETAVSFVPVYDPESRSSLPPFDCQKCARVNVIPFPCPECGRACYCSSVCRKEHKSLHRFECYGYQKHLWYLIGIAHLGIRSFLHGFGSIQSVALNASNSMSCYQQLMKLTECEENEFYQYGRVLRLVTNFDRMEMSDVLQYALAGYLLTIYLQHCTSFFSEYSSKQSHGELPTPDLVILCGALIYRHIGQLVCNGHAISELRLTSASAQRCMAGKGFEVGLGLLHRCFTSSRVFTAIFPRISMFNHSCDPNIRNHFERSTLTVYATRSVAAEGEIFNCYGPNYKLMPVHERKSLLKQQYCFDCRCTRCSENEDSFSDCYNMIECPAEDCGKRFAKQLTEQDLFNDFECIHCGKEISCEWYRIIVEPVPSDAKSLLRHIKECLDAYENSKRLLVGFNQSRASLLATILDHYVPYAAHNKVYLHSLKKLAVEYVSLRQHQFGGMSLEYIVGCFYLMDLLAMEQACEFGQASIDSNPAMRKILDDFCAALRMVGTDSRSLIMRYLRYYVTAKC
ncbi:SET and MYND domain-containing protein 4-like [Anopheles nili]|uniref:SET and MYND domain-containing protein 4-like n=1 Tax=Anopheles nili TaxID=185578 RepID=UPI00237B13E4|nr:SET and MYND domain-containing protein 4-like [Anopheles nili]